MWTEVNSWLAFFLRNCTLCKHGKVPLQMVCAAGLELSLLTTVRQNFVRKQGISFFSTPSTEYSQAFMRIIYRYIHYILFSHADNMKLNHKF